MLKETFKLFQQYNYCFMKSISMLFLFFSMNTFSQNIDEHPWENRLLLIISDHKNNADFTNQLQLLKEKPAELVDRKIIIYKLLKTNIHLILMVNGFHQLKSIKNITKKKRLLN